jgi:hypothetical protein
MRSFSKQCYTSLIHFFLFILATLLIASAQAAASFPLPPRFSANALASDYAVGDADLMLPLKGDNAHNLYVDPNLAWGSDNQGYADLGVGYRWIHNEAAILGGYFFAGYSRIDNNARLWVANPGIEVLGSRWDAHLNGYAVMGERNQGVSGFLGPLFFTGHAEYANLYSINQHAGHGGDVQIGYQLFPQSSLKGYVGSYFFAPSQVSNIWGGAAGLEYWLTHYLKVVASYTLDNVRHSTGALGIGVEFGGTHVHRSNPSLEERITDPVARYLSELGRGSAIPSRNITQLVGPQLLLNNIAFFSQSGGPNNGGVGLTLANCTFENPCGPTDFSQTGVNTLSSLLANTIMYFNGGSYPALNTAGTGQLTLNAGQSLSSRTADYSQLATGAERSIFSGGFFLNNNNTLENIILLPSPAMDLDSIRTTANGATGVLISGSQIGSAADFSDFGVILTGASQVVINNSEIYGSEASVFLVRGPGSNATIINSTLRVDGIDAIGLELEAGSVDITNSAITVTGTGEELDGIFAQGDDIRITMNNTQVSVTNSDGANHALVTTSSGESIQVNASLLTVTGASNSTIASGGGIQINTSTCILNGSQVICSAVV